MLLPEFSGEAGKPRKTPQGAPLPGTYAATYWLHSFPSADQDSATSLQSILRTLEPHQAFFTEIRSSGGTAELFIGIFMGSDNVGLELDYALNRRVTNLGLGIALDIYGPETTAGD